MFITSTLIIYEDVIRLLVTTNQLVVRQSVRQWQS